MKKFLKNPELIEKDNPDSKTLLLFNVNSGRMFEMNETARLLWNKTGESFNLDDLKNVIELHCHSVHDIDRDMEDMINTMLEKTLVSEHGKN
jgi:hypothetical protein